MYFVILRLLMAFILCVYGRCVWFVLYVGGVRVAITLHGGETAIVCCSGCLFCERQTCCMLNIAQSL